jgi:hypothetical protein
MCWRRGCSKGVFEMNGVAWIKLNKSERTLLLGALAALRSSTENDRRRIDRLTIKLIHNARYPEITVGVHGGQVQWTMGNPFPVRVCDYDGVSDEDLPDIDERGERCRIWWEPPNSKAIRDI